MISPVDEKLELLSLSNEEFADGLARMVKLFTTQKDAKKESPLFSTSNSSGNSGNYLLLENNMPISGG